MPRYRALHGYLSQTHPTKALIKPLVPRRLSRLIGDRICGLTLTRPALPEELRRQLIELYREDIIKLQDMLRRDLSHWLK